ncbi:MAG: cupin domain-containing protein [Chloroflexota bacterium]
MLVRSYEEVEPVNVEGVAKRVVIGAREGAPNFVMRVFEIPAGKTTERHSHDWEHEGMVLAGQGAIVGEEGEHPLEPGMTFFVPPNEKHQLVNKGQDILRFVCLVPLYGEQAA